MTWLRNLVFGAIKDLIGLVARQLVVLAALYLGGRYAQEGGALLARSGRGGAGEPDGAVPRGARGHRARGFIAPADVDGLYDRPPHSGAPAS